MSTQTPIRRTTVPQIRARKGGAPIVSLTSYHAHTAAIVDKHADFILVGDSLGMVMHGMDSTIGVPTVRESDGLAMSSRNVRLTPQDRAAAPVLDAALSEAEALAAEGTTASRIRSHVRARLEAEPRADVQSVDIRDADTLAALSGPLTRPAVVLLAVRFGTVLLIDNRVLRPPSKEETP